MNMNFDINKKKQRRKLKFIWKKLINFVENAIHIDT